LNNIILYIIIRGEINLKKENFNRAKSFDINRIVATSELDSSIIKRLKVSEDELEKIYNDYSSNINMFQKAESSIISILNEKVMPHCHSLRSRVKDPDHLIAKIIRNAEQKGGKYLTINSENYLYRITDLLGIRLIVLRQKDWKEVHRALCQAFKNDPSKYVVNDDYDSNYNVFKNKNYMAEVPVVYITSENDRHIYDSGKDIVIKKSNRTYRSIHYIIHYENIYFEIQVRTLFEEGWLEFDHNIKYPNDTDNPKKKEFLDILSYIAFSADSLISFYDKIERSMNVKKKKPSNIGLESKKEEKKAPAKTFNEKLIEKF